MDNDKIENDKIENDKIQRDKMDNNKIDSITKHLMDFESNSSYANNIGRPLSIFKYYIKKYGSISDSKIGLALCHGHNHNHAILNNIKYIDYWYMVDIDSFSYPDYVCDIRDINALKYFPDNFFDCIISVYCPIGFLYEQYFEILTSLKHTLTANGFFVSIELPSLIFWFLDQDQLEKIADDLYDNIYDKIDDQHLIMLFDQFKEDFDYQQLDGLPEHIQQYLIISAFYDSSNSNENLKINLIYTKKVLKNNNFRFVGMFKKHLYFV